MNPLPTLDAEKLQKCLFILPIQSANQQKNANQLVGNQVSNQKNSGMDFSDLRPFQIGDNPKHIDWRATARNQQQVVRTFHHENQQQIIILIDLRSSLFYGTQKRLKVEQIMRVTIALVGQAARNKKEICIMALQTKKMINLGTIKSIASVKPLIDKLLNTPTPKDKINKNWSNVFSECLNLNKGSKLIILSDFLGLKEENNKAILVLTKNYQLSIIQVLDTTEITFKFSNNELLQFSNKQITVNNQTQKTLYKQQQNWLVMVKKIMAKAPLNFLLLPAKQDDLEGLANV